MSTLSWLEARELLTGRGYGVNDAQQILDDLAWFAWSHKGFSVTVGKRACVLRYDNASTSDRPLYTLDPDDGEQ